MRTALSDIADLVAALPAVPRSIGDCAKREPSPMRHVFCFGAGGLNQTRSSAKISPDPMPQMDVCSRVGVEPEMIAKRKTQASVHIIYDVTEKRPEANRKTPFPIDIYFSWMSPILEEIMILSPILNIWSINYVLHL